MIQSVLISVEIRLQFGKYELNVLKKEYFEGEINHTLNFIRAHFIET